MMTYASTGDDDMTTMVITSTGGDDDDDDDDMDTSGTQQMHFGVANTFLLPFILLVFSFQ